MLPNVRTLCMAVMLSSQKFGAVAQAGFLGWELLADQLRIVSC
jgi:hypothetical protein